MEVWNALGWFLAISFFLIICFTAYLEHANKEDRRRALEEELQEKRYAFEAKMSERISAFDAAQSKREAELTEKLNQKEAELQRVSQTITQVIDVFSSGMTHSNLSDIPYLAGFFADFDTHWMELLAQKLDWGSDQKREKKVMDIRLIRAEAKARTEQYKEAQYQLDYAIRMFPALADFLETEYSQLPEVEISTLGDEEHDRVRDYLSKEEYQALSTTERNQRALDRYRESHRKTNWQIGRDYELYVGYECREEGYEVEDFGSNNGLEDLGRDVIARKDGQTLIIQCKYWSSKKQIHENHINQLYGTTVCYCLEHNINPDKVKGVLVTNIELSDTARRFADYLGIAYVEKHPLGNYPCIKCKVNYQDGEKTKIYHLPFDQQYDACKIKSGGDFVAWTVAEAEKAGFRRAYRWHGGQ